jgi:hypothetical protein
VDPQVLSLLQSYSFKANTIGSGLGDGLNAAGFTFAGPAPFNLNTYIAKLDYNLTSNGNHRLFVRGNFQNDIAAAAPQFPGEPPNLKVRSHSKGIAAGYTTVFGTNLINNFRFGYIRQDSLSGGINDNHFVRIGELDLPIGITASSSTVVPVHNFVDDIVRTKGKHTIQFGSDFRIIDDVSSSTDHSFNGAAINVTYLLTGGFANKGTSFDPAKFSLPPVATFFQSNYDQAMGILAGLIPVVEGNYNRLKTGKILPEGFPVTRHFRGREAEVYLQDSWQASSHLTITAGIRYALLEPPYEVSGNQVSTNLRLSDFFDRRAAAMLVGQTFNLEWSPILRQPVKAQNTANGGFESWDCLDGDLHVNSS